MTGTRRILMACAAVAALLGLSAAPSLADSHATGGGTGPAAYPAADGGVR